MNISNDFEKITDKQKQLIEQMNEFCDERFEINEFSTKKQAQDYISRNIELYKLLTMSNWDLKY